MNTPPPQKRIRLTISVPQNVHEMYRELASVTGRSIGMEMGDWLDHTSQAAYSMLQAMAAARDAPKRAVEQINDLASALSSVERVRRESAADAKKSPGAMTPAAERTASGRRGGPTPRPVIRGVNLQNDAKPRGSK